MARIREIHGFRAIPCHSALCFVLRRVHKISRKNVHFQFFKVIRKQGTISPGTLPIVPRLSAQFEVRSILRKRTIHIIKRQITQMHFVSCWWK